MKNKQAIGLFDSGIGGTSIWKEVVKSLPYESTVYLADSLNAPYGQKSKNEIIDLCVNNTEYLLGMGAKLIVVACNTATTNAIDYLRDHYNIPFIGIEPAIKPAALYSKTGAIGILATKGTLTSDLFAETTANYTKDIKTIEQIGEGIVRLMESGKSYSPEMTTLLEAYLSPMLKHKIDHLVLGCTHYPYLIPQIKAILGPDVTIIDSGEAVARQTRFILNKNNLLNTENYATNHAFITNGDPATLQQLLSDVTCNYTIEKIKNF